MVTMAHRKKATAMWAVFVAIGGVVLKKARPTPVAYKRLFPRELPMPAQRIF